MPALQSPTITVYHNTIPPTNGVYDPTDCHVSFTLNSGPASDSVWYTLNGQDPVPGNTVTGTWWDGNPVDLTVTTTVKAVEFHTEDWQTYTDAASVLVTVAAVRSPQVILVV